MRILSRGTLRDFWQRHPDAEGALAAWFEEASAANWTGPIDIRNRYRTASFVGDERVIFNIGGNKYRLIVHVLYTFHVIYTRFVGTHAEYDKVNAASV